MGVVLIEVAAIGSSAEVANRAPETKFKSSPSCKQKKKSTEINTTLKKT